uniref:Uncharacterized protein n=1 Tax=Phlebotomus papatasi TaxID=29031 RepID=A0A1B0DIX1_PHLPP
AKVLFKPTDSPQFVTVSGVRGEIPSPIVLDPGHYTIKTTIDKVIFLDYFVLLPAAYYEASILTRKIENPCEITDLSLCSHFKYPSIKMYTPAYTGYNTEDKSSTSTVMQYSDYEHLSIQGEDQIPVLNGYQPKLYFPVRVWQSGKYILVVDYITRRDYVEPELAKKIVHLDNDVEHTVVLNAGRKDIGIISVTAIPLSQWSLDYVTPSQVCVMRDGECVKGSFRTVPDSKKIEFETDHEDMVSDNLSDVVFDNNTKLINLNRDLTTIEIRSKVPSPGRYVILVKFYQPYHPKFNIDYRIQVDQQTLEGKFPVRHCPSNIGCREVVKGEGDYIWFDIEDSFGLTLTNADPSKEVWLDFVLLVPADQFK